MFQEQKFNVVYLSGDRYKRSLMRLYFKTFTFRPGVYPYIFNLFSNLELFENYLEKGMHPDVIILDSYLRFSTTNLILEVGALRKRFREAYIVIISHDPYLELEAKNQGANDFRLEASGLNTLAKDIYGTLTGRVVLKNLCSLIEPLKDASSKS